MSGKEYVGLFALGVLKPEAVGSFLMACALLFLLFVSQCGSCMGMDYWDLDKSYSGPSVSGYEGGLEPPSSHSKQRAKCAEALTPWGYMNCLKAHGLRE